MTPITRLRGQKILAVIWFILSVLLIFLSLNYVDKVAFGDQLNSVLYNWLASTLAPTLSLIAGSIILSAASTKVGQEEVDKFFFRIAMFMSFVYFSLLFLVLKKVADIILHQVDYITDVPLDQQNNVLLKAISTKIQSLSLWVSLLQGTVSAFLGIFFIKKK